MAEQSHHKTEVAGSTPAPATMKISREKAIEVIERFIGDDRWFSRGYFEAIRDDRLPRYYEATFLRMRYAYRDDLPPVDVRNLIDFGSGESFCKYKCQGNYVAGLCIWLNQMLENEVVVDGELVHRIRVFLTGDLNFQVGDSNNGERIERINGILDEVLAYLGGRILL